MKISFDVKNQILSRTDKQNVIANSTDYLEAEVTFSDDWADLEKNMQFVNGANVVTMTLTEDDGKWIIAQNQHLNLGIGTWKASIIGVGGDKRIVTNEANLAIRASGWIGVGGPIPSVYEQLLTIIQSLHTEAASSAVIRSAVQQYIVDNYDALVKEVIIVGNVKEIIDDLVDDGTISELLDPIVAAGLPDEVTEQLPDVVDTKLPLVVADQLTAEVADQLPAVVATECAGQAAAWLSDHVDPDTGYVIDDTLTIQLAAADAKKVGDEVTNLKSALNDLLTTSSIPPKLESDAFYTNHSDTGFYVSNREIASGSRIESVRIKANSTKVGKVYIIDSDTKKVLYIKSVSLVSGWNAFNFDWLAPSDCIIGFNGCYLDFRSGTAVTDDDTLLNNGAGLYEATPKTAVEGDTLTITQTSATGRYAFAVDVKIIESGYIKSLQDNIDTIESEIANYFNLNNGNLLRYKEINDSIGYLGRWWDYNGKKCTNADGSELYFKTAGASVATLTLGQINAQAITPYIAISIDGGDFVRQQIDNTSINLPDTGEHIVRVMIDGMAEKNQYQSDKWEKRVGVYVTSLTVDAGTITGILPVNKVGMFFGDSVTEGINALGTGANASVNSASNAFPYFCTKVLNAVSYRVGYGGTGLTVTSSFHPCIDAIDWDAYRIPTGRIEPDFIVVNHGINDYGASVSASDYISAYEIVIDRLRVKYSSTPIFCVVPFRAYQPYSEEIEEMCADYSNCYFVSSGGWNGETTDGTHLSALGAKNNGEKLAKEILKVLGNEFFINI